LRAVGRTGHLEQQGHAVSHRLVREIHAVCYSCLYRMLGAGGRREVVQKARELGLYDA